VGANLHCWHQLVLRIANIYLNDWPYIFRWSLNSSGQFSVSSMYNTMLDSHIVPHNIYLWKLKLPFKIKVFLWLLYKKVILTKNNLVKRNCHGNKMCCFCDNYETIQYLFFNYGPTKFIWQLIYLTFGLRPPGSINYMFGTWVLNMNGGMRKLL
jgi:hypothetical protein